jgi:tetratricopeptide (TPR) repeat protein
MSKPNHVILDKDKKFSASAIWDYQRDYFDKEGVDAWVKAVPHYVTSNPFLANCYAHVTVRLALDWVRKHPEAKNDPFYVMELGTGCGQLSFYILKKIKQLRQQFDMEDIKICYLMTDFTESNVKFWDKHPALQEFLEDGSLEFAIFNMESDTSLTLKKSGITLSANSIKNPLVLYANYIFDSISNDTFTIKDGNLYASLVSVSTPNENLRNGKPAVLEEISLSYKTADMPENYYEDADFNTVLSEYKQLLKDSNFLFPIAGLRAIKNIKKLCNGKFFMLSTDKGYSYANELEGLDHPYIDFHGSFSLMVNFHAIARYVEQTGGKAIIQSPRAGIKTNIFYNGFELEGFPELSYAVKEHITRLSPGDYFVLHRNIRENFRHCVIDTLGAHMTFTGWDPHIYEKITKQVCEQIVNADRDTIDYFVEHMPDLAGNFYYMPRQYDVLFDIGVLLHTLRKYGDAIGYYKKSQHYFGEKFDSVYNLAICEYNVGQVKEALVNFKHSLTFNPNSDEAKRFIEFIENTEEDV